MFNLLHFLSQGTVVMYNLDPDATNEDLVWLFSKYGDVCKIQEAPDRRSQKIITFYDVRHAQIATQVSTCSVLSPASSSQFGVNLKGVRVQFSVSPDSVKPSCLVNCNRSVRSCTFVLMHLNRCEDHRSACAAFENGWLRICTHRFILPNLQMCCFGAVC